MEITWSTLLMVQVCAFDILVRHLSDHLLANFIFIVSFMFSRSLIIYSLFINLLVKMIFLNFHPSDVFVEDQATRDVLLRGRCHKCLYFVDEHVVFKVFSGVRTSSSHSHP
jgi:hypothetical protein